MENNKTKIMISAYACEPYKGSEIGVGWNWVLEISKYFEVWVVTRANNQRVIEDYFDKNQIDREIHFIYYDLPNYIKKWKKQMRGVRIYYNLWQYGVNALIKKTMKENDIDIFHLLTYGNAIWHISSFGQKKFFVWGPTGGTDIIEKEFSRYYGLRNRFVESVRRVVVRSLCYNPSFRKQCKNANLIFCKTSSTIECIPKKYRDKAIIFTDVAADIKVKPVNHDFSDNRVIEYIIVGKLDSWRGYDLLLEAFAIAIKKKNNIHLTIIGNGTDRKRIEKIIKVLRLEYYVTLVGEVPINTYEDYIRNCDVVVNTSLKEGAVTVSFDTMSYGKPFVCIDTTGYTRYFDNTCAKVISRTNERERLISELASSIIYLTDGSNRKRLSDNISKRANSISWEVKGKQIYEAIYEKYKMYKQRNIAVH